MVDSRYGRVMDPLLEVLDTLLGRGGHKHYPAGREGREIVCVCVCVCVCVGE